MNDGELSDATKNHSDNTTVFPASSIFIPRSRDEYYTKDSLGSTKQKFIVYCCRRIKKWKKKIWLRGGGVFRERGVRDFRVPYSMEHIRAIQVVIISANCWGSNQIMLLILPRSQKNRGERKRKRDDEIHCFFMYVYIRNIGKCCAPSFFFLPFVDGTRRKWWTIYCTQLLCVCYCHRMMDHSIFDRVTRTLIL